MFFCAGLVLFIAMLKCLIFDGFLLDWAGLCILLNNSLYDDLIDK